MTLVIKQTWETVDSWRPELKKFYTYHLTRQDRDKMVREYQADLPRGHVPDAYDRPCGGPQEVRVPDNILRDIQESDDGIVSRLCLEIS